MVGDNAETDIAEAAGIGAHAIWIDKNGTGWTGSGMLPVVVLDSLADQRFSTGPDSDGGAAEMEM